MIFFSGSNSQPRVASIGFKVLHCINFVLFQILAYPRKAKLQSLFDWALLKFSCVEIFIIIKKTDLDSCDIIVDFTLTRTIFAWIFFHVTAGINFEKESIGLIRDPGTPELLSLH